MNNPYSCGASNPRIKVLYYQWLHPKASMQLGCGNTTGIYVCTSMEVTNNIMQPANTDEQLAHLHSDL